MSEFKKAVRTQRPLRMAIYGPSNSGKTFTSLLIARELVGPDGTVALIDTERSSASIYAKDPKTGKGFEFDQAPLTAYTHTDYINLIEKAHDYDFLIVDSISHAWEGNGGILDLVEEVTNHQTGKNKDSFRAWASPRVKTAESRLWAAVLSFPGHIIVTMRAKTAYERSTGPDGRAKIEKLGLEPKQRSGIEFEFDVIAEMDKEHWLEIDKARDPEGKLEGQRIHKPGAEFVKILKAWLDSGSSAAEDYEKRIGLACEEIARLMDTPIETIKKRAWEWIKLQHDTDNLSSIRNEDLAQIPGKLMDNFGPGDLEEQRQSRMAEREDNDKPLEPTTDWCYDRLSLVVEENELDKEYIWSEICNRSKSDEPTLKELGYFVDHITKHPDLWQKIEEKQDA